MKDWDTIDLGMHVCSIFRTKEDQFPPVASFFNHGMAQHDKCCYIHETNTPTETLAELSKAGLVSETPSLADVIELVSYTDSYVKDGEFDAEKLMALVDAKILSAAKEGYSGIRVAGEMTWVLTSGTPMEKLIEYESKLNLFFPTRKLAGICQYDETRFDASVLISMICSHPYLIVYGKLYQNKYFYTDPKYGGNASKKFKPDDYQTMLSVILEDSPVLG